MAGTASFEIRRGSHCCQRAVRICLSRDQWSRGIFTNVMEMLRLFDTKKMVDVRPESAKYDKDGKEIRASEEDLRTQLDLLFEDWEVVFPTSYAVKQYKIFQMAGRGKSG